MPKKSAGTTLLKSKAMRIEIRGGNNETHPGRTLMASSETTFPSNINFADSDEASVNLKKSNSILSNEEQADGSIKFGLFYLIILSCITWFVAYILFKKGYKIKS